MAKLRGVQPKLLIVGGNEKNVPQYIFDVFDVTRVEQGELKIPKYLKGPFIACVVMKGSGGVIFCSKSLQTGAREYSRQAGIPFFFVKTGNYILHDGVSISAIKNRMLEVYPDLSPKVQRDLKTILPELKLEQNSAVATAVEEPVVDTPDSAPETPAPALVPVPDTCGLSDDDLWAAYRTQVLEAIQTMKTGEKSFRSYFKKEVLSDLAGIIWPQDQETMIQVLYRRGVITTTERHVIIGRVEKVDRDFISNQIEGTEEAQHEEAAAEKPKQAPKPPREKPPPVDRTFKTKQYMKLLEAMPAHVNYPSLKAVAEKMMALGIHHENGKPLSESGYALILKHAEKMNILRVVQERHGKGTIWRITVASKLIDEPILPAPIVSTPVEEASIPEVTSPAVIPAPAPTLPPTEIPLTSDKKDKPGVITGTAAIKEDSEIEFSYQKVIDSYGGKIPLLMSLKEAALALKSVLPERVFDEAASRAVALHCGSMKPSLTLLSTILRTKLEYTDEEWLYMAIEQIRDLRLQSLFGWMRQPVDAWYKCVGCGTFFVQSAGERSFIERIRGNWVPPIRCQDCRNVRDGYSPEQKISNRYP